MEKSLERFIAYTKIDTQSNENSDATPSESKELNLSRLLLKELDEMGIKGDIDRYGRLYAKLPGEEGLDTIGLNAHVDTAGEISGKDVKPRYIANYDGGDIILNNEYKMNPSEFPSLKKHIGDDLIVTGGDTLLGGDDKAGVAIIMATLDYLVHHKEVKHHPISILFTPDEEIGRGPDHFDKEKFGATYAYTIDGDYPENIDDENFNAAHAIITIQGVSIHPGEAKGKMVNAARLACEFDSLLSPTDRPELTEGREGFNHLLDISGNVDKATVRYIIRNHDGKKLEEQKHSIELAVKELQRRHPAASVSLEMANDYRNMKEIIDKDPRSVVHADKVFASLGIKVRHEPIRGGTDGAVFSFMGCPTPNLGTGSYNHHGRFEYLSVRDFKQMIKIVTALVKA